MSASISSRECRLKPPSINHMDSFCAIVPATVLSWIEKCCNFAEICEPKVCAFAHNWHFISSSSTTTRIVQIFRLQTDNWITPHPITVTRSKFIPSLSIYGGTYGTLMGPFTSLRDVLLNHLRLYGPFSGQMLRTMLFHLFPEHIFFRANLFHLLSDHCSYFPIDNLKKANISSINPVATQIESNWSDLRKQIWQIPDCC